METRDYVKVKDGEHHKKAPLQWGNGCYHDVLKGARSATSDLGSRWYDKPRDEVREAMWSMQGTGCTGHMGFRLGQPWRAMGGHRSRGHAVNYGGCRATPYYIVVRTGHTVL